MVAQPERKQRTPQNITEEEAYSVEHALAKNIKMFREIHGLTQEDVARAIGSSLSAVSKWESAVMVPRPEWLASLAKLYDIPVGYLFGVEESKKKNKRKKKG